MSLQAANSLVKVVTFAFLTLAISAAAEDRDADDCDWDGDQSGQSYNVGLDGRVVLTRTCPVGRPPTLNPTQRRLLVRPFNETTRYAMTAPLRFRMLIGPLPSGAFSVPLASVTSAEPNPAVTCPNLLCSSAPPYGPMRRSIGIWYSPENHRASVFEQMHYAGTVQPTIGSLELDLPIESLVSSASGAYTQIDVEYIYQYGNLTMTLCSVANASAAAVCSESYYSSTQYYGFGSHTPDLWLGTALFPHPSVPLVRYCKFKSSGDISTACDIL
jgi:hypothetical protein